MDVYFFHRLRYAFGATFVDIPSKKVFVQSLRGIFVAAYAHSFLASQILDIIIEVENQDEFSENFCMTVIVLATCFKIRVLLSHRERIVSLVDTLQKEPYSPINAEEDEIRSRYNKMIEWNTLVYMILFESCAIWIHTKTLFTNFKGRILMFRAWMPYDYSSAALYLLTYAYQVAAGTICTIAIVSCDTLYSGLLLLIYYQFELLEHRVRNVRGNEKYSVKQCARHHHHIYKYAKMINDEFKMILLYQFLLSVSVLCINLYRMMQIKMDSKFVELIHYSLCTLTQIFYYCWYGNEVKLKSLALADVIFASDWTSWNNNTKKAFLMVMRRATKPIECTSIHVVSVNLDSFMTLLKTSYSAFNIMKQSQEL